MPSGPGIRVDTHIEAGDRIPADYDNLIAKLMVHAHDRDAAIDRLRRALDETEIGGVQTTLPFHRVVAASDAFRDARLSTGWVEEHWKGDAARAEAVRTAQLAAGLASIIVGDVPASTLASEALPSGEGPQPAGRNGWRSGGRARGADRWPI
jgi:acetyl/propionyl-CoA carboxylase alpha subunit